jgi:hypothetical protein
VERRVSAVLVAQLVLQEIYPLQQVQRVVREERVVRAVRYTPEDWSLIILEQLSDLR